MHRTVTARHDRFALNRPFRISRGVRTEANAVSVTIAEGEVVGRGEAIPYTRYGETVESVLAQIEGARALIADGGDRPALAQAMPAGAARNALDCALWDLVARRSGKSVAAMIGAPAPARLASALTVVIDTPEAMARAAAALADRPLIKVKVDANDPAAQVRAVRAAAPKPRLIVDPNESWDRALLEAMMPVLVELRADLLEQPVPADDDDWLAELTPAVPICADEAVHVTADLPRLVGRYSHVNVKLDTTGGLTEALTLARDARAAGFGLMTGCMVCSSLSIAPALHIARMSDFADLDGPVWLAEDRPGGVRDEGGWMVPPAPGFWGDAVKPQLALLSLVSACSLGAAPAKPADLLIRGGTIYPGGAAPFVGDVAISGDRIVAVGPPLLLPAKRAIDATGMIVAPGFIDPHTHIEGQLASDDPTNRLIRGFLMQGVTTAVIGNDGGGSPDLAAVLGYKHIGVNYAARVGFGAIRQLVIGDADRAPTDAELAREKQLVARGMCGGAIGFSSGLFYAPQSFSKTAEVGALAAEAGKRGGFYDTHIRDESSYGIGLAAAIDEAIEIGRLGHLPVHISHIKALGVDVQGQAPAIIAKIEAARRAGQDVTADQYPWAASGTSLVAALVPRWAQDGGRDALLKRFDDPALATRLRADMGENLRKRGGAGALMIAEGTFRNQQLDTVAKSKGLDPVAAAIAVIRVGDPSVISLNQDESDIAAFMRQPWVMTGSDTSFGHPRAYGSFARKYAVYVKERGVIDLRAFIDRSTALTADTLGLVGRGRLRRGNFADVVVFDSKTYAARATYQQPVLLAAGVRTVLVNGVPVVDGGATTGAAPGRALAKTPRPGSCR